MTVSTSPRKTVLVAADTPFVRDRFQAALDASGHRAVVVKSVAQLLARVHADLDELDLIVRTRLEPSWYGAFGSSIKATCQSSCSAGR
jgi:DNA-binding NtrC family response regulator